VSRAEARGRLCRQFFKIAVERTGTMERLAESLNNENGAVIFVAIIFLALLTLVGVSSINTSTTEVHIAANTQANKIEFYVADSGWKEGAMWLDDFANPPNYVNNSGNIVRNFGDGGNDVLNNNFPDGTQDSPHDNTANDMSYYAIPYWFKVTHLQNETYQKKRTVEGSSKSYMRHYYRVDSNANRTQEVEVVLSKIFKIGYN
jgi:Tfp pilus assembly protein PilX